jgi:serine/threonine protein kinase
LKRKLLIFLLFAAITAGGALAIGSVFGTHMFSLKSPESIFSAARQNIRELIVLIVKLIRRLFLALPLVLLVMAGIFSIRYARRPGQQGKPETHPPAFKRDTTLAPCPSAQTVPELVGLRAVEAFFLNLYRLQLEAPPDARGLITSAEDKINGSGRIYNLSVYHNGQWVSRHMTIRPIGEVSHSKSQCFYVIFDTHIVVKIPPTPIRDFSDYIHRIERESRLVEKLSPRICIIPNISVILSRVRKLAGLEAIPASGPEEKCVRFLNAASAYQRYLKIGGTFAFFMDLSRHFFLSDVLSELHDVCPEVQKNIASDAAVMLQGFDFEAKYGSKNAQICLNLQEMYVRFESALATCLVQPDAQLKLSDEQKREWFFTYIVGETISRPTSPKLSDAFMDQMRGLLKEITSPSRATLTAYQKMVRDHAGNLVFNQNRPQFEEMVTNLLDLLVFLYQRGVSLRDLKPDNLLVAGKTKYYPLFLLSANDYSIGLIDLETAVELGASNNQPPIQPHLAGTPAYATPSHFAANDLLMEIHGNLPWIFHLQDWYATVGIIYEIVMGRRLFLKTGSQIPGVIRILQQAQGDPGDLKAVYLRLNGAFWKSARAEFSLKTKRHESRLDAVMVRVPTALKHQFETYFSMHPEKMKAPLLSDRSDDFRFILSVKNLLTVMFEVVAETLDEKDLPELKVSAQSANFLSKYQNDEYATCSIGYTLTGEIHKA